MYISKTKTYSNLIPLSEIKTHLRIHESDNQYDQELRNLTTVALADAERFLDFDIVPTVSIVEENNVTNCYVVNQRAIHVNGISGITYNSTGSTLAVELDSNDVRVDKYDQYSVLYFTIPAGSNINKMLISYNSGSSVLSPTIKMATLLRIAYYFDLDRSGASIQAINNSKAWERLLSHNLNYL